MCRRSKVKPNYSKLKIVPTYSGVVRNMSGIYTLASQFFEFAPVFVISCFALSTREFKKIERPR